MPTGKSLSPLFIVKRLSVFTRDGVQKGWGRGKCQVECSISIVI
jgi:hypothetical protein